MDLRYTRCLCDKECDKLFTSKLNFQTRIIWSPHIMTDVINVLSRGGIFVSGVFLWKRQNLFFVHKKIEYSVPPWWKLVVINWWIFSLDVNETRQEPYCEQIHIASFLSFWCMYGVVLEVCTFIFVQKKYTARIKKNQREWTHSAATYWTQHSQVMTWVFFLLDLSVFFFFLVCVNLVIIIRLGELKNWIKQVLDKKQNKWCHID